MLFSIFLQRWVVSVDCSCTPFSFSLHSSSFSCAECLPVIIASCFFPFAVNDIETLYLLQDVLLSPVPSTLVTHSSSLSRVPRGFGSRAMSLVEVLFSWPTSWASMEIKTALGGSDERFRLFLSWAEKQSDSSLIQSYSSRLGTGCLLNYSSISEEERNREEHLSIEQCCFQDLKQVLLFVVVVSQR